MYFKKHLNKPTSALTLAPIMVIAMTLALTIGLAQPDSAMASTHSNSSAPDAAPAWILGDNPLSGDTTVGFGQVIVRRLGWYSRTQVVTIADQVWQTTPVAWEATGWTFTDRRTWIARLKRGYRVATPKVQIPVSTLAANFYGANIVVKWKTLSGVVLAKDVIDYSSLSDYGCAQPAPQCEVVLNKDGLGATLYFATSF
jgi:hypothetical protein